MVKSWEAHKAEMKKDEAHENRNVILFCVGIVCFVLVAIALAPTY